MNAPAPAVHDFENKLGEGEDYETLLDTHFSKDYDVSKVDMNAQRAGIDRIFTRKSTGVRTSIEYKADSRMATTGNVFIETVSVDTNNKPGWALTSCAQILVYYIPQPRLILKANMLEVKKNIAKWKEKYGEGSAQNRTYRTIGVLVPLPEFRRICFDIETIDAALPNSTASPVSAVSSRILPSR